MNQENAKTLRTREAIEANMQSRDYAAARTLILEALKTYPRLDQASEMLMVCEILCSAEMELPRSGIDWYWILQLYSAAAPSAIEAQYRKIVSQLKPIMHDFPGTELALNFATDAFTVLSDPEKRAAFDSKRQVFQNITGNSPSLPSPSMTAEDDCSEVEVIGEKRPMKIYAMETSSTNSHVKSLRIGDPQQSLGVLKERPEKDYFDFKSDWTVDSFSEGQVWATYDEEHMPRHYGKIDKIIPRMLLFRVTWYEACPQGSDGKKWSGAGFPLACGTFVLERDKITFCEPWRFSHMIANCVTMEPFEVYPMKGEVWAMYRDWDIEWCSEPRMREESGFEMIEILTDYSKDLGTRAAYLSRVEGFKNVFQRYSRRGSELSFHILTDKILMFSHKVPAFRFIGGEMAGISKGMLELDPSCVPDNLFQDLSCGMVALIDSGYSWSFQEMNCSDEGSISNLSNPPLCTTTTEESSQGIRSQKSKLTCDDFLVDQIWAVYDGPDAMPRSYVRIIRMVSPTKICVAFLEPHPMLDQEIRWVEDSLPMACGVFRSSRSTTILDMSKFSHIVNCESSLKKLFYRIFPKKGEIWAIYKNWNIDWKISDHKGYRCQMVEILSDFSEECGVSMCCLVEVPGYLTFFQTQMHDGFKLFKRISRLELLSFSHQIPAFTVIGIQNHNIPKGSLHLEPDALPRSS